MGNEIKRYIVCVHCSAIIGCCQGGNRTECGKCPDERECPNPAVVDKPSDGHCKKCEAEDLECVVRQGAPKKLQDAPFYFINIRLASTNSRFPTPKVSLLPKTL